MRLIAILLLVVLLPVSGWGASQSYYVSPSGSGTDCTSGSPCTLSQAITNGNGVTPTGTAAGQGHKIYLAPGTYYGTSLNITNANWRGGTLQGASTSGGTDPAAKYQVVLSGSWDTTGWTWSDESGGIYSKVLDSDQNPGAVWNGTTLLASAGATCTLSEGQWGYTAATKKLCVYVAGGTSPATDGTVRVPSQNYVILTGENNQTFSYMTIEAAATQVGGAFYNNQSAGIVLDNCVVRYSALHQAYLDLGAANASQTISNCFFEAGVKLGNNVSAIRVSASGATGSALNVDTNTFTAPLQYHVSTTGTGGPATATIHHNTMSGTRVSGTASAGILIDLGTGWNIHSNTISNIGDSDQANNAAIDIQTASNTVNSNTISHVRGWGIRLLNGNSSNVYSNTIYNAGYMGAATYPYTYPTDLVKYGGTAGGGGIYLAGTSAANNVYRNLVYNSYQGIGLQTTGGTGGNSIYYNLAYAYIVNGIGDYADGNPTNRNTFYNNSVYHSPSADNNPAYTGHGFYVQDVSNGHGKATFANNICYNAVANEESHCFFITVNSGTVSVWANNNIWGATSGAVNVRAMATSYTDLATYQAGVQGDAHFGNLSGTQAGTESASLFSDPLLYSSSNLQLQSSSPAINAGVNVTLTTDYAGTTVPFGRGPDIGAYESQTGATLGAGGSVGIGSGGSITIQ